MKQIALLVMVLLLVFVFGNSVIAIDEVMVPLGAIKFRCYDKIDPTQSEFLLSEIGEECVLKSWLEDYLPEEPQTEKPQTQSSQEETTTAQTQAKASQEGKNTNVDQAQKESAREEAVEVQPEIEEEPVTFVNRDVELMVRQEIGKAVGDVFPSDFLKIKQLSLTSKRIEDLTWIKHFKNLENLNLIGNEITDLSPLAALIHLQQLRLQHNNISDLTGLSSLYSLKYVNLSNNNITDIKPLAENNNPDGGNNSDGLSKGDRIYLERNNLDLSEGSEDLQDIQALMDRGATVIFYPQKQ